MFTKFIFSNLECIIRKLKTSAKSLIRPNEKRINSEVFFTRIGPYYDLVIFDDIFPDPKSDWRLNEFLYYVDKFPCVKIYTGTIQDGKICLPDNYFKNLESDIIKEKNIFPFKSFEPLGKVNSINTRLVYFLFFNNLKWIFPILERLQLPFAFTLYPGGGFSIYDNEVKNALIIYTRSPLFRHIFVNMPNVYDYLINEINLNPAKISYHFSVPIDTSYLSNGFDEERYKSSILKVCFAAHKYMRYALNKGFDVFCEVAKRFEEFKDIQFYVMGDFTASDNINVDAMNINYLGEVDAYELSRLFSEMHIFLSPVRSHVLHTGNFDGFPTGAAMNAVLNGCVLITTDPHDNAERLGLRNNVDLFLTSDRTSEIFGIIDKLRCNRTLLYNVAESGYNRFKSIANFQKHKQDKFKILESIIS